MSDKDRYGGKYGEKTATWANKSKDKSTIEQYNVKNVESGDHYFTNTKTGVMGTALSDYRPFRSDKK